MKKYKFGVATKKLVALTLCCLTAMTSLTSCSATPHYNMERLQADTGDRFYDTRVLANSLYSSGLISKDSYNTIMDRTSNLSALIAKSMKAAKAEDTSVFGNTNEVIAAWASLSSLDIFYDNNFSNNNNYQDDTFNLLQGIIAFKPVNHSKNDGHTIEDAISVDDGSVRTDKDAFGQPWLEYYSKSGGNDLYGNDNWGGKGSGYKRPDSVDDLNGSEMLYSIVNLMCIHKMLFNVNEGYANTHLDRWFVKGAYVDSERKIISLDTKYNTWGYYNDWDSIGSSGGASQIISDIQSGGNRASSKLNDNRNKLVSALGANKDNSKQSPEIKWVSEDQYFSGLTRKGGVGYTLSTYGNASTDGGNSLCSHSVLTGGGTTEYIPIDTRFPYSAINSTTSDTSGQHGTIEPSDASAKTNKKRYTDDDWDYNQDVCFPVNLVPPSVVDEFEKALDLPLYTIRPDAITSGGYTAISNMIGNDSEAESMLSKYFTPAMGGEMNGSSIKQSNSGTLKLRDILYAECEKLANGNDAYLNYLLNTNNILMTSTWNDNPVGYITYNEYDDDYNTIKNTYSSYGVKNEPGKDIVFCQKVGNAGQVTPVMAIRVNEFNLTYCSMLNSVLGLFNDNSMTNVKAVADADYARYKLVHNSKGEAIGVVLLEYPIDAIRGFSSNNDGTVSPAFADSGMGINVGSGKVIKYNYLNGKSMYSFSKEGNYISDYDSIYYNTSPGSSQIALGSTIKVLGSKPTPIGLVGNTITYQKGNYSSSKQNNSSTTISKEYGVYAPRFYLTVYLEALYAPGLTSDSDVALFGRRFYMRDTGGTGGPTVKTTANRSLTLSGGTTVDVSEKTLVYKLDDTFADYIDLEGNKLSYDGEQLTVKISDLCSMAGLTSENPNVRYFSKTKETIADIGSESKEHTVTELQHEAVTADSANTIYTSYMFASDDIGKTDADAEKNYTANSAAKTESVLLNLNILNPSSEVSKKLLGTMGGSSMTDYINQQVYGNNQQISITAGDVKTRNRFWCMAVKKSLFSDEVYNGWLAASGHGSSLAWWNTYLETNSFAYRITAQTFNSYAKQNYKNQMIARGEIEDYDLSTINDIKDYYKQEEKIERVRNIRTVFKIVGYIIIAFAFILMLLWAIDTNTDLGLNLLQKVTFGNWVAIKYASDIPDNRNMDKRYVTGGKIIVRGLILIAVGLLIIVVNAFDIVRILVDTFGTLGRTIEDLIRGN